MTSPDTSAPLYCPAQARSDCNPSRSACAIALAVCSGFCGAGRTGAVVVTTFGLAPAVAGGVITGLCRVPSWLRPSMLLKTPILVTNPEGHWKAIDVKPIKAHLPEFWRAQRRAPGFTEPADGNSNAERRRTRTITPAISCCSEVGGPGQTALKEASRAGHRVPAGSARRR